MNSHQLQTDIESATTDSVTSTPRSDYQRYHDGTFNQLPQVRFMCSFGGKILPRPHDNQLRYVGGDTRIVAVPRHATFASLHHKLAKLSGTADISIKYQLPSEDLDALITVTADEDVENMMEEFDRLAQGQPKAARLRLFLFPDEADSRTSSISSLLDGSTRREHWFLDALNGGPGPGSISGLERGKSEASSIVSEVPDYLFGLENSDDPSRDSKIKTRSHLYHDNISNSDPGSPAPVVSSPFGSTSSALPPQSYMPPLPDLPPVKTKPINSVCSVETPVETADQSIPQQPGFPGSPMWHYVQDPHYPTQQAQPIPFYYVTAPVPHGNVSVQPVTIRSPYAQPFQAHPGQMPMGYSQPVPSLGPVYGGEVKPMAGGDPYDKPGRVVGEGVSQPMYFGGRKAGMVPVYQGMVRPGGEEIQGNSK